MAEIGTRLEASFEDLISPLSRAEFFARYWETAFLHLRHAPDELPAYFSMRDIPKWLKSTRDGVVFALVPDGDGVRFETQEARRMSPGGVEDNFRRGFSQIFKFLADWPALQPLVQHLAAVFHATVHVNAFLTPAGPSATRFPTYLCNEDIFVLQVEGEEIWTLRQHRVLQLDLSQKTNFDFPEEWRGRAEAPVEAEIHLQPGDLLYIPRGTPHSRISAGPACLELRIYVTPLRWVDFVKTAAEVATLHSAELRKSLPPGFLHSDAIAEEMHGVFRQLLAAIQQVPFDPVLAAVRRNRAKMHGIAADDLLEAPGDPEAIGADSEVEHRPDLLCAVEVVRDLSNQKRSTLFFGDAQVSGPPSLLRALKFVRDHSRFRVSEIPGLDAKGQLVLARRLVAEGLLRLRR